MLQKWQIQSLEVIQKVDNVVSLRGFGGSMSSSGISGQRWELQTLLPQVPSSAGSISCAVDCSSLRPALVLASRLLLSHFPAALRETSAFEQRSHGCPLSLSTSGCPGWIDRGDHSQHQAVHI